MKSQKEKERKNEGKLKVVYEIFYKKLYNV